MPRSQTPPIMTAAVGLVVVTVLGTSALRANHWQSPGLAQQELASQALASQALASQTLARPAPLADPGPDRPAHLQSGPRWWQLAQ
jgi:hypothetical protein